MTRWLVILMLATLPMGCAKVTPETPKAAAAIKADAVVIRLNEVQAALQAFCGPPPTCQPNTIDTNTFQSAVQLMIPIRSTLLQTPQGWLATARTGWAQVKQLLTNVTNATVQIAIAAVDALLGGL